jgi:lipid-binding SYLF domain-containing protein
MNAGRTLKKTSIVGTVTACCLMLAANPQAQSQAEKQVADEVNQSEKAARVLHELMAAPDEGIPQNLLDKAECVAVFPSVIKAGFVVGGRGGRGVASCRTATGWSAGCRSAPSPRIS